MKRNRLFQRSHRFGLHRLRETAAREPLLHQIGEGAGAIAREARRRMVRGRDTVIALERKLEPQIERHERLILALGLAAAGLLVAAWVLGSTRRGR